LGEANRGLAPVDCKNEEFETSVEPWPRCVYVEDMQIQISDEAAKVLEKKGGTMSIDFIRPTG
jgi:hypothetical protein